MNVLFQEGSIGKLTLPNRILRAATVETMATDRGEVTQDLVLLYEAISRGRVGLIFTGHAYVHPRGQCSHRQIGIYEDSLIPGLKKMVDAVHRQSTLIFAQLGHAGIQSRVDIVPLAPSPIPNPMTGRTSGEATKLEVQEVIGSFGAAAKRAMEAGFDGIHIHAANGYLISEFNSPFTNRRNDEWGGDPERRGQLSEEVYRAVREVVGSDVPITMKLGVADAIKGGLEEEEGVRLAARLEKLGLDGIEVSCGVAHSYGTSSILQYAGVDRKRALSDHLYHRLFSKAVAEAYFLEYAKAIKTQLKIPVILAGGLRTPERMAQVLAEGDADFVAMSRPFIREPELARLIKEGRVGMVKCTSCNLCLVHSGKDPLRCWRESWRTLFDHAWKYYVRDCLMGGGQKPSKGISPS